MTALEEVQARIFDARFRWDAIDRELALSDTAVLELVREACLIEGYFGAYTGTMLELFWYDVDATSVFAIEAFEAYSHFYLLRRYLDTVGYRPVSDEEIRALRARDRERAHDDEVRELVNFMLTEHFAAQFFSDLAERAPEPVLAEMLRRLGREEVTHSALAAQLLAARIAADPGLRERVVALAREFEHVGAYVLPRVSNASDDNLAAILRMDRQVEELTGSRLVRPPVLPTEDRS